MSIRTQPPPNLIGKPSVDLFFKDDFEAALWQNGYQVQLESAVACPCNQGSAPSPGCSNCLGTGWVFVNPIETRAFITSINRSTKYKDWSPEMVGTIAATFMRVNRFSFMDKITLLKNYGMNSETLQIRRAIVGVTPKVFVICTYKVIEIESVFMYNGDDVALIKLTPSQYSIDSSNKSVVMLTGSAFDDYNGKISVTYSHNVTYNIVDIPHDMRMSWDTDHNGTERMHELPIQCIARKSAYELGVSANVLSNNLTNNSYK